MKKIAAICLVLGWFQAGAQQKDEIKITDLELPSSPAFTIIDYTPTTISTPETPQAVVASLLNGDAAVEFSPYWLFTNRNRNFSSYFEDENKDYFFKPYKNMTFSFASVKTDEIHNVSGGIRTNILTVNRKSKKEAVDGIHAQVTALVTLLEPLNPVNNPFRSVEEKVLYDEYNRVAINNLSTDNLYLKVTDSIYKSLDNMALIKPIFTADLAAAYNHIFDSGDYNTGRFARFGAWLTLNQNIRLGADADTKNYLCLYQYGRFMADRTQFDADAADYVEEENFDVGGKLELQFNKLSVGYEYINRTQNEDDYRSVGSIRYVWNDKIAITGGFGKNFEGTDTLVSFLGISWGISANNDLEIKD